MLFGLYDDRQLGFAHIKNWDSRHHAELDEYVLIKLRVMVPGIANIKSNVDVATKPAPAMNNPG